MHLQSPLRHMAAKPTTSLTDAELQLVLAEAIGEAESPQAPDPTNIAGLWNVAGHRGIAGQREATGEGEARTRLGGGAEDGMNKCTKMLSARWRRPASCPPPLLLAPIRVRCSFCAALPTAPHWPQLLETAPHCAPSSGVHIHTHV